MIDKRRVRKDWLYFREFLSLVDERTQGRGHGIYLFIYLLLVLFFANGGRYGIYRLRLNVTLLFCSNIPFLDFPTIIVATISLTHFIYNIIILFLIYFLPLIFLQY